MDFNLDVFKKVAKRIAKDDIEFTNGYVGKPSRTRNVEVKVFNNIEPLYETSPKLENDFEVLAKLAYNDFLQSAIETMSNCHATKYGNSAIPLYKYKVVHNAIAFGFEKGYEKLQACEENGHEPLTEMIYEAHAHDWIKIPMLYNLQRCTTSSLADIEDQHIATTVEYAAAIFLISNDHIADELISVAKKESPYHRFGKSTYGQLLLYDGYDVKEAIGRTLDADSGVGENLLVHYGNNLGVTFGENRSVFVHTQTNCNYGYTKRIIDGARELSTRLVENSDNHLSILDMTGDGSYTHKIMHSHLQLKIKMSYFGTGDDRFEKCDTYRNTQNDDLIEPEFTIVHDGSYDSYDKTIARNLLPDEERSHTIMLSSQPMSKAAYMKANNTDARSLLHVPTSSSLLGLEQLLGVDTQNEPMIQFTIAEMANAILDLAQEHNKLLGLMGPLTNIQEAGENIKMIYLMLVCTAFEAYSAGLIETVTMESAVSLLNIDIDTDYMFPDVFEYAMVRYFSRVKKEHEMEYLLNTSDKHYRIYETTEADFLRDVISEKAYVMSPRDARDIEGYRNTISKYIAEIEKYQSKIDAIEMKEEAFKAVKTRSMDSALMIIKQLDNLKKIDRYEFGYRTVNGVSQVKFIIADTIPLVAKCRELDTHFYIGRCRITVDIPRGLEYETPEIRIQPLDAMFSAYGTYGHTSGLRGSCHPHVNAGADYGAPCLGNANTLITQYAAESEYGMLLSIIVRYLESVNIEDSAGRGVTNWPVCDKDGNIIFNKMEENKAMLKKYDEYRKSLGVTGVLQKTETRSALMLVEDINGIAHGVNAYNVIRNFTKETDEYIGDNSNMYVGVRENEIPLMCETVTSDYVKNPITYFLGGAGYKSGEYGLRISDDLVNSKLLATSVMMSRGLSYSDDWYEFADGIESRIRPTMDAIDRFISTTGVTLPFVAGFIIAPHDELIPIPLTASESYKQGESGFFYNESISDEAIEAFEKTLHLWMKELYFMRNSRVETVLRESVGSSRRFSSFKSNLESMDDISSLKCLLDFQNYESNKIPKHYLNNVLIGTTGEVIKRTNIDYVDFCQADIDFLKETFNLVQESAEV